MRLEDITERDQLAEYYGERDLTTTKAKIVNLKETMQIRAIRYGSEVTAEEMLEGLEESAVSGNWKYLCH